MPGTSNQFPFPVLSAAFALYFALSIGLSPCQNGLINYRSKVTDFCVTQGFYLLDHLLFVLYKLPGFFSCPSGYYELLTPNMTLLYQSLPSLVYSVPRSSLGWSSAKFSSVPYLSTLITVITFPIIYFTTIVLVIISPSIYTFKFIHLWLRNGYLLSQILNCRK